MFSNDYIRVEKGKYGILKGGITNETDSCSIPPSFNMKDDPT